MQAQFTRHLPVAGTYNVRDLGGYAAGQGRTRWRQVLRADALHRLDQAGVAALTSEGVRTVIDLRHAAELEIAPNPFSTHPEVRYHNISLFENITPPANLDGGSIDILLEMYKLALSQRSDAVRMVMLTIAEAGEGAVLFHCTAGKDRTGVIAALLLGLSGVDAATIREDYALTSEMIAPMIAELLAHATERGASPDAYKPLLAANPVTMEQFLSHVEQVYGGAEAYLESIGIDGAARRRLRDRLVETVLEEVR